MRGAFESSNISEPRGAGWIAVAVLGLGLVGCKTGAVGGKPSWWAFGGGAPTEKLATAPAFGPPEKPSASAKPYPTTSTPNAYSLAGSGSASGGVPAAEPRSQTIPAAVTYGSTPSTAAAPVMATAAEPARREPPLSSIAPQVGPYSSLPGGAADPPRPETTGAGYPFAAAATPARPPVEDPLRSIPAQPSAAPVARVADARASTSLPPSSIAPPTVPQAGTSPDPASNAGSRYSTTTGSRFSGGPSDPPTPGTAEPAPAAMGLQPVSAPAAPASTLPSGAPPTRRPDPGYRPARTSSYQPNSAILAGEAPTVDAAVRPASFEGGAFPNP